MNGFLLIILGWSFAEISLGWTYHYSNDTMTWTQAREWCQAHFTEMVVIQKQTENDYIVSILPNRTKSPYYWIGITKKHINETWRWVGNNSTWVGEHSWAKNEPNNNHSTEFCVEIYVNTGPNRGKWNDEKCANKKSPVCYKAVECPPLSLPENGDLNCSRGGWNFSTICRFKCHPGFILNGSSDVTCEANRTWTDPQPVCSAVKCPLLSQLVNGSHSCSEEGQIFNSTCHFKCHLGFFMIGSSTVTCAANGDWTGPRPVCTSYKQALLAVAGCGALSSMFCICFCCMKHRKKKKLAQERQPEEATSPSSDVDGGSTNGNSLTP
ncbi:hypothetical protein ILYODFUR_009703 [Ilyodon furcidens]|uniref:Uncharacterized protein n=1 Tax=Ilyodon furcidens TaxID=33524 RepID=A0ABV0U428_9TELE